MLSNLNRRKNSRNIFYFTRRLTLIIAWITGLYAVSQAQTCPPNIDFETGGFDGWTCYTGSAGVVSDQNVISLSFSGPVPGRHTMYTRTAVPEVDPYGGFPVVCPNGSGHSIRLGNNIAGTEAEGVSYEFTIPADRNVYSLIYHYAVVFQDPNHLQHQQPRMEIEITNVTDNTIISCSSFTFVPYGSPLPGFFISSSPGGDTPVWCKDWSAVSINLDGHAGKTIRLFFKTADCTFRRHFGYAYIDLNSECSGEFTGAKFCPGDTAVQLVAPFGYQGYTWSNTSFTQVLGNQQTLTLRPAPSAGTILAVQVGPYYGYGCPDTLYARLSDTFRIKAQAGADGRVCNNDPIQIGAVSSPGVFYQWSPSAGLTDPSIANPFANPRVATNYVVTSRSYGGGCMERDTVAVTPVLLDSAIKLVGRASYCLGSGDSAVLQLTGGAERVQWFRNTGALAGANAAVYKVSESGSYYAVQYKQGCTTTTARQAVSIEKARPGIVYPVVYVPANTPVTLQARPFGDTIHWQPPVYLNTATSYKPVFSGPSEQTYAIEIKTAADCKTVDSQAVKIVSRADIFVPTAFTPNRDGRNDILRPILFGIKELRYFRVYNRWGEMIFETRTPNAGWDGTSHGTLLANQAVVWVAEGIGLDGRTYLRKGTSICIQ